ncbi:MAG: ribonuclease P protein component [Myxococcales bacterium]|nr:ribonuclease P protein component [Myxococcales bacterium]MDH3482597.1 ribonuclease P protein component [Myxococcales bacterium]
MRGASGTGGGPSSGGQGLRRADRLKKRYEFRQVQLTGRRIHTPHFLIVLQPNSLENTRLGITVTKKVGNAVQRNRIKRVVREVFRRNRHLFPPSHDIVFVAKRDADAVGYDALLKELRRAAVKLREGGAER